MNYIKILGLTMYLQLETPVQISLNNYQEPYFTCDHQLYNAIQNIDQISLIDGSTEAYMTNTYQIEDTVRGPYYALNAEQYEDLVNGYAEETNGVVDSQLYKHFALLFRNATDAGYECRQLIDFFYHFLSEIGIIKNWYCNGHLDFYENEVTWKDNYRKNFDKNMKCALLKIAKLTIKEELEYNLRGVLPTYDTKAMAPGWHIIDLLTGLYFSIFYMHPGIEIYRKCANPNCNRYFLVKTTNTRKKYCNAACSNAMAQRNHRKKVKVKKAVQ